MTAQIAKRMSHRFSRAARAVRTAARLALMSGRLIDTGVSPTCFSVASALTVGRALASKYLRDPALGGTQVLAERGLVAGEERHARASSRSFRFSRRK